MSDQPNDGRKRRSIGVITIGLLVGPVVLQTIFMFVVYAFYVGIGIRLDWLDFNIAPLGVIVFWVGWLVGIAGLWRLPVGRWAKIALTPAYALIVAWVMFVWAMAFSCGFIGSCL